MDRQIKVPEAALAFWLLKVLATTLGETGGDAVTMSMDLGYLVGTLVFAGLFAIAVTAQVTVSSFRPWIYWLCIVATTTVGTTLADFADRSLGIGYPGGAALLALFLGLSLLAWKLSTGTVDIASVSTRRAEFHYWTVILFSQTLGTALGDWTADSMGLGYLGGAILFAVLLLAVALLWRFTRLSRTGLFWAAFVLTRPLGAVAGDLIDKPLSHGGLAVSRYAASGILAALMIAGVFFLPQRPAAQAH